MGSTLLSLFMIKFNILAVFVNSLIHNLFVLSSFSVVFALCTYIVYTLAGKRAIYMNTNINNEYIQIENWKITVKMTRLN